MSARIHRTPAAFTNALSEASLETVLIDIKRAIDSQGKRMSIMPTHVIREKHPYWPPMLPQPFVVAVSGGRGYRDRTRVDACLQRLHSKRPIGLLVHGNARGADRLARDWAEANEIPFLSLPARWNTFGQYRAGPLRNFEIGCWKPHLWLFFPGGTGTEDAYRVAKRAGIPRRRVR